MNSFKETLEQAVKNIFCSRARQPQRPQIDNSVSSSSSDEIQSCSSSSNELVDVHTCKSDCSHCLKIERKENADRLVASHLARIYEKNLLTSDRGGYFIGKEDSYYDAYQKQINVMNDNSLNLENVIPIVQDSAKKRRLNIHDAKSQVLEEDAEFDLAHAMNRMEKITMKEKEASFNASQRQSILREEQKRELDQITSSLQQVNLKEETSIKQKEQLDAKGNLLSNQFTFSKKRKYHDISNSSGENDKVVIPNEEKKYESNRTSQAPAIPDTQSQSLKQCFQTLYSNYKKVYYWNEDYIGLYKIAEILPQKTIVRDQNERTHMALQLNFQDLQKNISQSKYEKIVSTLYEKCPNDNVGKEFSVLIRGINQCFVKHILQCLTNGYQDKESIEKNSIEVNSKDHGYALTQRSCFQMLNEKPISDEIINAYLRLIAKTRSSNPFYPAKFHIFDTLFYFKLSHLMDNGSYNFLQFSQYFDKQHFASEKNLSPNSVLLFVINNEDFDYALIAVDIQTQKIILYDCVGGRQKDTFLLHVKKIKRFLADYFECFPPQYSNHQSSQQPQPVEYDQISIHSSTSFGQGGQQMAIDLNLDQLEFWQYDAGLCSKIPSQAEIRKSGQGIYILKVIDMLTQCQVPIFDHSANEIYNQIAVELLTAKLLSYS